MEKKGEKSAANETAVEVTIVGAKDLKNTKMFGKMSPVAVVSIENTPLTQVSKSATNAGPSPSWNQTMTFNIPDAVLSAQDPPPTVKVEIFDSSDLSKSLGVVRILLTRAIAYYDLPQHSTLGVIRKNSVKGYLSYALKCGKASFAPPKGTPEYCEFVKRLDPSPDAVAGAPPAPHYHAEPPPSNPSYAAPVAAGALAGTAVGSAAAPSASPSPPPGYPQPGYAPAPAAPVMGYPPPAPPTYQQPPISSTSHIYHRPPASVTTHVYHQPSSTHVYHHPAPPATVYHHPTTTTTVYHTPPAPYAPPPGYGAQPYGAPYGAYPGQQTVVVQRQQQSQVGGMGGLGMGALAGAAGGLLLGAVLFD